MNAPVLNWTAPVVGSDRGAGEVGASMTKRRPKSEPQQLAAESPDELLEAIAGELANRGYGKDDPILAYAIALHEFARATGGDETDEVDSSAAFTEAFSDQWGAEKNGKRDRKFDIRKPQRHDKNRPPAGMQVVKTKSGSRLEPDWLEFDSEGNEVQQREPVTHDLAYACRKLRTLLPLEEWEELGVTPPTTELLKLVYRTVVGFEAGLEQLWVERLAIELHKNAGKNERRRFHGLAPIDNREAAERILARVRRQVFLGGDRSCEAPVPDELTVEAIEYLIPTVGYGPGGKNAKRDARKVAIELSEVIQSRKSRATTRD